LKRFRSEMPKKKNTSKTTVKLEVVVNPPETTEDFIALALEKGSLDEVVKILRDCYGSQAIRKCLNKLPHKDPIGPILQIRRHALEIYAKRHGLVPANLMASIVGNKKGLKDPADSERKKLKKAREILANDKNALAGAKALANDWNNNRPKNSDHGAYLKKLTQRFTFSPMDS
jgi:hypothetical protein